MSWGLTQNWSTVVAAAVLVLVAASTIRRHVVSPVVLVSGLIPLGAALAMFKAIMALMRISSLKGEALSEASDVLNANVGAVFTTSLAIALGLAVGMAIVRLARREKVWEGV
jgi:ATP/ADP translocase